MVIIRANFDWVHFLVNGITSSIFAGSLESANSSILPAPNLFKDFGGEKSGFYVN